MAEDARQHDLAGDAEVDLKPLGGGLVLGTPGSPVWLIHACISLSAVGIPVGRVDRRRCDLRVADTACDHAECRRVVAACNKPTHDARERSHRPTETHLCPGGAHLYRLAYMSLTSS